MSAYNVADVPAAEVGSRFFLSTNPAGNGITPGENVARVAHGLVAQRIADMDRCVPERRTVSLFMAAKVAGEWRLFPRGEVSSLVTHASERPGKRTGLKPSGEVLDSFLLGGESWEAATDDIVWASLLAVCAENDLSGAAWRMLNDSVARLVAARAGCGGVTEADLPHPAVAG